jgi:MFS transporter, DHA1 family, multidrug resistance protein
MNYLENKNLMIQFFPWLLVCYEIINYLANDMYLPALPSMMSDLGINTRLAQQTVTAWFFGASSLHLLLGPISDRFGRKPVLLIGGVLFTAATWICALTSTISVLLVARFIQGAVVSTLITAGYASIHEIYHRKQAMQILALMMSVVMLAPAVGPLVGGFFLQWLNWRWIFVSLALSASIIWLGLCFIMPETLSSTQRLMFRWSHVLSHYRQILKNKAFIFNLVIISFNVLAKVAWIVGGPFLIISQFKLNTLYFGLIQILIFFSQILGAQLLKRIIHRVEINRLINQGLSISLLASILAVGLSFIFPDKLIGFVICLMIFCFGTALSSPLQRLCIEASPEPMGARMAVYATSISLFCSLASFLFSFIYTGSLLWFASLLFILAGLSSLLRWFSLKYFFSV